MLHKTIKTLNIKSLKQFEDLKNESDGSAALPADITKQQLKNKIMVLENLRNYPEEIGNVDTPKKDTLCYQHQGLLLEMMRENNSKIKFEEI